MQIDRALIGRLAELCRLPLSGGEAERMAGELSRILDYAEQLGAGDGAGADLPLALRRRADDPAPWPDPAGLIAASAGADARGTVRVPPVRGEAT